MALRGKQAASWESALAHLAGDGEMAATPFQQGPWTDAWYATLGAADDVTPVVIELYDDSDGATCAVLPLIKHRQGALTVISFADKCVTDYNAPVIALECAERTSGITAQVLGDVVRECVVDVDLVSFDKMPAHLAWSKGVVNKTSPAACDRADAVNDACQLFTNPLATLAGVQLSEVCGSHVLLGDDWEVYQRQTLKKKFRKEMERSWRVFERAGDNARFERITDHKEAEWALCEIERLQAERVRSLGLAYELDGPAYRAFYRVLLRAGLDDGCVVLSVLRAGADELVAGLIGLRHGDTYAMVRLGHDIEGWSQCSPGKLVIERTMHELHSEGVRDFDFTTGEYTYKQGFGVEQTPLYSLRLPLTMRGRMYLGRESIVSDVKTKLRRYPRVYERLKSIGASF